ncbi:hypothetical protein RM780_09485 [Streptomyces sp. DSM 44917]|uniref:Secreted protein n=1 Tax=Streptomyces boetiae TaxID=3075541 RepID=A0ABU2L7K5_9ACTN|nr:hypothetical protein [Streptomyces sp. DSM 44917]MDT0307193.1 hypothetical protein [Streptomyces sp. DSM 44917]
MAGAIPILIVVTFGYIALCAVSPFGRCRACDGIGFQLTTRRTLTGNTRPHRGPDCRRCEGTGRRLRTGRRIHNAWTRLHHDGTR